VGKVAAQDKNEIYNNFSRKRGEWIENPELFLVEAVGINICECKCELDPLQREIYLRFCELVRAKQYKGWLEEAGKAVPEEIDRLASKVGASIQSGKGVGKTAICSMVALWFFVCFDRARVVIMGPKYDQIKKNLWSEISKWIGHAVQVYGDDCLLNDLIEKQTDKIYCKHVPKVEKGEKWVMFIMTFPKNSDVETQKAAVQGQHDRNMLFLIDEASGVPDHIFEPIESTLTFAVNVIFAIFNPNKNTGWAIETQGKMKDKWVTMQINAENSTLVKKDTIDYMKKKYGVDSNKYRVSVLGLPPLEEEGALIPWSWIQAAKDRYDFFQPAEDDPYLFGIDVGGGGDDSMLCKRKGGKILSFKKNTSSDTDAVASWVMREHDMDVMKGEDVDEMSIDMNGIGNGAYHRIKNMGYRIKGVNVRKAAANSDRFVMIRDELYWRIRCLFEDGDIAIPPDDDELEGELSLLKYDDEAGSGKIKVLSKKDAEYRKEMISKLGYKSPNRADALALTCFKSYSSLLNRKKVQRMKARDLIKGNNSPGWMAR